MYLFSNLYFMNTLSYLDNDCDGPSIKGSVVKVVKSPDNDCDGPSFEAIVATREALPQMPQ